MVHKSDYIDNSDYPLINPANIIDGKIDVTKAVRISADKAKELERYILEEYDILLARRGDLSKCAIVINEAIGAYCGTGSFFLHLNGMDARFFSVVYGSTYLQKILKSECVGATMDNLNQGVLENILMPYPPLSEQQRIVAEIEKWFTLIDTLEADSTNLQNLIASTKSKVLDLAIHGKLVPQDPNDEPAIELLKCINPKAEITCDNGHYTQLPEGWVLAPMQMLCSLIDGEKVNGKELPYLDVKSLRGERGFKSMTSGRYVPANSLMILVDGENSGEVFRTEIEGYQGSTFKQLYINENMFADYVLHIINLHRRTLRENKIGSAIPHLNKKLFKAIEVPIPPYNEQVKIVAAINSVHNTLNAIMGNL